MARMTGKIALVVGGAKGIGLATARALADEGAFVLLTGRRQHEVFAAAESIGRPRTASKPMRPPGTIWTKSYVKPNGCTAASTHSC
jgi:NAD(P)-dependent dehydrogenase (short-subunit alcohol dehydrogenase family)